RPRVPKEPQIELVTEACALRGGAEKHQSLRLARLESSRRSRCLAGRFRFLDCNTEIVELIGVDTRWRVSHQVLRGSCLRKRNHLTDRFLSRQQHHDAIHAQRDSAVRRRSIRECVEEESEALTRLLVRKAECFEHASLNILPVNSD